jgi:hypothetical protein
MTAMVAARAAGRGRQAAAVEAQRDYREELTAVVAESREFAQRVRLRVDQIKNLIAMGADMAAINEAGKVGYDADRRLEQLGSVVL